MEVSGEAADLVMKEGVQISEEAIKLLARGAKNLAALLYALAKDQKKLYGKVNMNRLLSEQRPIEVLPLRTEDFDEFKRRAKKVGLLFSTILDKKGDAPYLEILTNIDHLSQANYILEQMGYQPRQLEDAQPKKEQTPARPEPSLQKQRSGLTQGPISTNEEKQPVRGRLARSFVKKNSRFVGDWRHYVPPQSGRGQNPSASWSISDKEREYHRKLRQYYQ